MNNKKFVQEVLNAIRRGNAYNRARRKRMYVMALLAFGLLFLALFFGQSIYDSMVKKDRCRIVVNDYDVAPVITGMNVPQVITYSGTVFRRTWDYEVLCEKLKGSCVSRYCTYNGNLCSCILPNEIISGNSTNQ